MSVSPPEPAWSELAGRLRAGAWIAFAGLGLQLIGIIWDTLMHHRDPGLATRESVVSLTNPSHLLMAAGTTVTAIGVGLCLYHLASARSTPRASTRAAIAVVALVTLWLGTMTVSLRTGGISGRHDHADPDSVQEPGGAARELPAPER
jgi:hypothetical protein